MLFAPKRSLRQHSRLPRRISTMASWRAAMPVRAKVAAALA